MHVTMKAMVHIFCQKQGVALFPGPMFLALEMEQVMDHRKLELQHVRCVGKSYLGRWWMF